MGEKKSEGKEGKTKKARAALAVGHLLQPLPQCSALLPAWLKDERQCGGQRNVHHQHLLQNKNERKTKCSDEKEAIGNELSGNALFRE